MIFLTVAFGKTEIKCRLGCTVKRRLNYKCVRLSKNSKEVALCSVFLLELKP